MRVQPLEMTNFWQYKAFRRVPLPPFSLPFDRSGGNRLFGNMMPAVA